IATSTNNRVHRRRRADAPPKRGRTVPAGRVRAQLEGSDFAGPWLRMPRADHEARHRQVARALLSTLCGNTYSLSHRRLFLSNHRPGGLRTLGNLILPGAKDWLKFRFKCSRFMQRHPWMRCHFHPPGTHAMMALPHIPGYELLTCLGGGVITT